MPTSPVRAVPLFLLMLAIGSVAACELVASVDGSLVEGSGGASSGGGGGGAKVSSTTGTASTSTASASTSATASSSSVGSVTSSAGTGGSCATTACTTASDCPTVDCTDATCDDGCCGAESAKAGVTCGVASDQVCDGSGHCVGCNVPTDCPKSTTVCVVNTCESNTCGVVNSPSATACGDDNGAVCDGNGKCVACVAVSDCPASTTACQIPSCSANKCNPGLQPKGTICMDSGGSVCNDVGGCVAMHCTDGLKDADETDKDCGGSCGATCTDTNPQEACGFGKDCVSEVCKSGLCQPPSCADSTTNGSETDKDCGGAQCVAVGKACATGLHCSANPDCASGNCQGGVCSLFADGTQCSADNQCTNGHCIGGLCCNTGCSGTCKACVMALTGLADGTCGSITAGFPAPAGQCTASPPCGNDGKCGVGGVCESVASGMSCGSSACNNGMLTSSGSCDGSGTCSSGMIGACPGGVICASATVCKTSCSLDSDCSSLSTYCLGGVCVPKGGTGAPCAGNDQCTNGICGTSGSSHCCAAGCSSLVGACGATSCDGTGACVFPGNTVAPASLQSPGDCQKIVCNGSGSVTSVDDATDLPFSPSTCQTNPTCALNGSSLMPSFTSAATGTDCTSDNNPPNHVCGDATNGNIAGACVQCNVDSDCAAGTCNTSIGICQ